MSKKFTDLIQRDDRLILATALRAKMEENKWSIRDIAKETDVSRSTIANLLSGTHSPTLDTCYKLMRGLNLPNLLSDLEMLI
jgi:transcriptional regulator with XRE-family HTH domain